MLRNLRSRRRPRYGTFICAVVSALLLLLSMSLLHTRLSHSHPHPHVHNHLHHRNYRPSHVVNYDNLLSDSVNDESENEDKIDALDIVEEQQQEEDDLRTMDVEEEDEPFDHHIQFAGYFFDHISGVIRRVYRQHSIEEWDDGQVGFFKGSGVDDHSKAAFGSDDVPVDEQVRRKAIQVMGIEDALLLKNGRRISPLREGWGDWFDKKGDFLRKDKMLKSNSEALNPLHNPILQDPDGLGATGITRGDRVVQKSLLNGFKGVPFIGKKLLSVSRETRESNFPGNQSEAQVKECDRETADRDSRIKIKESTS